jgi:hypothetical protein
MKKLLLATVLTLATATASAGVPDFIAKGGFKNLCDELGWHWGYDTALLGGIGSYACYSTRYIKLNRISTFYTSK